MVGRNVLRRKLDERCPECGYPTLEQLEVFEGEQLAVSTCLNPKCDFFDWEAPEKSVGEAGSLVDEEVFDRSQQWAWEKSREMRHEFFSKQPIKIEVKVPFTSKEIEEFIAQGSYAYSTEANYRRILYRFLNWLSQR